ncbi:hypothetical protein B0H67DRAFT_649380 [Lasiosphaeris hirsuta]|uniref:Survival Motor Neuron Gemin2-binding domain-containing protein n=1 Tax=Lasiosphaeris hirsuta TaxID=260670 RepID=A0AA40DJ16_9PEZI|nr:hypothetical protein B0H67DRAFT_649380 [Lasiosphaeris hirsuta]
MDFDHQISHNEIWDDSALVDSWNQALEEYKASKYHSVHAAGGTVEDITEADQESAGFDAKPETEATAEPIEHREAAPPPKSDETRSHAAIQNEITQDAKKLDGASGGLASQTSQNGHGSGPPVMGPQGLLGSVHDEDMKKLLMSWYYAGYYTGLYEGKQQGIQQAEQQASSKKS